MTFKSILFADDAHRADDGPHTAPEFFADLNLDQIVSAVTAASEEYDLASFFHIPLHDAEVVRFRHEVARDLEIPEIMECVRAFASRMRDVRGQLAQAGKRRNPHQERRWFLESVDSYVAAVASLAAEISGLSCKSQGFAEFDDYLRRYVASDAFTTLQKETVALLTDLSVVRYTVLIDGLRVSVRTYEGETDYGAEVAATFERFRRIPVESYKFDVSEAPDLDRVEADILTLVAQLHGDVFARLESYRQANRSFLDDTIVRFDREVQFYVAYLDHIGHLGRAGLRFCYPRVSVTDKTVHARGTFDLALAGKLTGGGTVPVCNDFRLSGCERIVVVSGPNQGGKTTFARTFGQLHYLASLGLAVPGTDAQLHLADALFTHFEREEHMVSLRGKLQDDLVRIHDILQSATPDSIVIINEIFASTALRDAVSLSRKIAAAIVKLDLLCVWVTFIDEVAAQGPTIVSMVSTVVPDNPEQRSFKIVRRKADGLAYAMSIAEKYRLTDKAIKERIGR